MRVLKVVAEGLTTSFRFAYHFTHEGQVTDIEHIILVAPATGNLPGTQIPKALEGNVNPFERQLLFRPRLTLYINRPEWEQAFRSPHYAVVLGRSQDLFTYTRVEVIELQQAPKAYFEHTLAPYRMALEALQGIVVLMPRYLDNVSGRTATFARYTVLRDRVLLEGNGPYWIDPTSSEDRGAHLGLAFLTFVGSED